MYKARKIDLRLTRYFNFRLKYVGIGKRQWRISKEIAIKLATHPNREAVYDILLKTHLGEDLNPYQSKESFNADYHDQLFNDWRIHHLHLNSQKVNSSDYFNARTGALIFVMFTDAIAYFIALKHHKDTNVWSDRDLLRILNRNWPEVLKKYEVPWVSMEEELSDKEIGDLRKANLLTGTSVDGKTYLMIGDGQATSGDNILAGRLADEVFRWCFANDELRRNDQALFITELRKVLCF